MFKMVLMTAVVTSAILMRCSINSNSDSSGKEVTVKVSATKAATTVMSSALMKKVAGKIDSIRPFDRKNFTPTKFEIEVLYITLMNMDWREEGLQDSPAFKAIECQINRRVNIAVNDELIDLVDSKVTVEKDQLGFYTGLKMVTGSIIRISADITLPDTTYSLEDVEVDIDCTPDYTIFLTDSFPITGEAVIDSTEDSAGGLFSYDTLFSAEMPTVRVILDATGAVAVSGMQKGDELYEDTYGTWIPQDSAFILTPYNMIIMPYVGSDVPDVLRFRVTWEQGWEQYIRIVVVLSESGIVRGVKHRVVNSPDFRIENFEEKGGLKLDVAEWGDPEFIQNGDGTWQLKNNDAFIEYTQNNGDEYHSPELSFAAFALESHSGMMTVGDTTVAYTATLEMQ